MTEPSDYYVPNGGWYVSQDQRNWILGFLDGGKKKTDNTANYQSTFGASNSVASPPPQQQYNYQPSSVASSMANIQQGLYQNSVINSVGNLQQSQFQTSSPNSTSNLHQGQYQNIFGNTATNILANTASNILANSATNLLANSAATNLLANSATNILFGQQSTSQSNFSDIQPSNSGNFRPSATFECRQCYAKFTSSQDLQYHMLRHAGGPENAQPEIQIQSPDFIQQRQTNSIDFSQQQQPQQQLGAEWGLYNCPQCLIKFNSSRELQYHMVYQCGSTNTTITQQHQTPRPRTSPSKSQGSSSMYQYPAAVRVKGPYPDHVIVCACLKGERLFNPCRAHKHMHLALTKLENFQGYKAFEESENIYYLEEPDIKSEPGVKQFECGVCNLSFAHKEGLLQHMPTHEGVKYMLMHEDDDTFECPQCFLRFKSSKDLHYHIMEHQGKKFFDCLQCGTKFTTNWSMQHHIKVVHYKEKDFMCPICHKRFAIRKTLKSHMLVHTQEKPYKCQQCEYSCNQRGTLKVHIQRKHTYEKPFKCEKCLKHFTTRYCLNQHDKNIHRDKNSLRCSLCEYKCKDGSRLKAHLKWHIEAPYRCKYCPRRFRDHAVFKNHVTEHKGKNEYQCKFCKFDTKHKHSFRYHMEHQHPGQMPYSCDVCGKKFLINEQLKRHMLLHTTDDQYDCPKCDYHCKTWIIIKKHFVKKHVNVDSLQCEICEVKFESLDEVEEHIVDHAERKRNSSKWGDVSLMPRRSKRKYKCQLCDKKFKKRLSFERHWRSHDADEIGDIELPFKIRSKSRRIRKLREIPEKKPEVVNWDDIDVHGDKFVVKPEDDPDFGNDMDMASEIEENVERPPIKRRSKSKRIHYVEEKLERQRPEVINWDDIDIMGDKFVVKQEDDPDFNPEEQPSELEGQVIQNYPTTPLRLPKHQRPCPKSKKIQKVRRPPPKPRQPHQPRQRNPHYAIPQEMYPVFVPRKPAGEQQTKKPVVEQIRKPVVEQRPQNLEMRPQNLEMRPQNLEHRPQNLEHRPQNLEHRPQNLEHRPQNLVQPMVEQRPQNLVQQLVDHRPQNLVQQVVDHRPQNLVQPMIDHRPQISIQPVVEHRPQVSIQPVVDQLRMPAVNQFRMPVGNQFRMPVVEQTRKPEEHLLYKYG